MTTGRILSCAALLVGLAECGPKQEALEIPTAPDMGDLIAEYNTLSASMDAASIEAIIATIATMCGHTSWRLCPAATGAFCPR